jgi:hypothetical protein
MRRRRRPQAEAELRRTLSATNCEVQQLKLEVLRWRKMFSLMRLKVSSYGTPTRSHPAVTSTDGHTQRRGSARIRPAVGQSGQQQQQQC